MKANDLFEKVTNDLVAAIEAGASGWRMPWHHLAAGRPVSVDNRLFSFKWGEGSEGRGGRHGGDMAHPVFRAIVPGQRSVELSDQSRSTEVARFAEANSPLR